MDKLFTVAEALELENHFISAGKSLRCALLNMGSYPQFNNSVREVVITISDVDDTAKIMRQWITDNTP